MLATTEAPPRQVRGSDAPVLVSRTLESACRELTRSGSVARSLRVDVQTELVERCGGMLPTLRVIERQAAEYDLRASVACAAGQLAVTLSPRRAHRTLA